MSDSLNLILEKLLQKNKISFNREELKFQVKSHPSYPSLHAITGVLNHFDIGNLALDIPQNNEVYQQLPSYFIAQLKNTNFEELVFVEKNNNHVNILYPNNKNERQSKNIFLKNWSGIIVAINEEGLVINKNLQKIKLINHLPLIILIGICAFTLFNYTKPNVFNLIHTSLSITGIFISILLLKHELGIHSQTATKLCTSTKKTSCEAVLNSKGANFFGLFKLSDISFVYFVSIAITGFILSITSNGFFNIIAIVSLLTIPAILYSIFYQGIVVKKWCPLCLTIGGILLIQSLISYFLHPITLSIETTGLLILITSLTITTLLFGKLKSLIISKLDLTKSKIAYYKFKRNFELFDALQSKKPTLNTSILHINGIIFGNKNATIKLVVITNPMCGYCKATHKEIIKLLNKNSNDIKVTIRFNINTNNKKDLSYKISEILQNLYLKDKATCLEAMEQIYSEGVDVNRWLVKFKKYLTNSQFKTLESESQWCLKNNINFTPTVYLNNREYPKEYNLSDLSFFMDDLIEQNYKLNIDSKITSNNELIQTK